MSKEAASERRSGRGRGLATGMAMPAAACFLALGASSFLFSAFLSYRKFTVAALAVVVGLAWPWILMPVCFAALGDRWRRPLARSAVVLIAASVATGILEALWNPATSIFVPAPEAPSFLFLCGASGLAVVMAACNPPQERWSVPRRPAVRLLIAVACATVVAPAVSRLPWVPRALVANVGCALACLLFGAMVRWGRGRCAASWYSPDRPGRRAAVRLGVLILLIAGLVLLIVFGAYGIPLRGNTDGNRFMSLSEGAPAPL